MQKLSILFFLTIFSGVVLGQNHYEKFKKLYKSNDTAKIKTLLAEWEKANPDDPELYTSGFNFYFSKSKQEIVSLTRDQQSKESFQLKDSSGEVAGYMGSSLEYNGEKLNKAFDFIDNGIRKFPSRLDMRFGKCYALRQIGDVGKFTNEVIQTIEYSKIINNNWLWTENKKLDDAENFMLGAIQTYLKELYETEDDNLLQNMIQIGDATLKNYPNNIEILSTTAVANMLIKNYDKAIEYLKQAEALNPKDFIVLINLAQGYKLKGDKANAIKYYQLAEKCGNEQAKQQARDEIKKLNQ